MELHKGRLQVFPPPADKGTGGDVDLTDYFTKTEIFEILRSYLTEEEINTLLDDYYDKNEIDDKLKDKADKSDLEGLMKLGEVQSTGFSSYYGLPAEALEEAMSRVPDNAVICRSLKQSKHVGNGDYEYAIKVYYRLITSIATASATIEES
ncbi:hypothetical protein [Vibrio jasicida]|uniref:Uncharacterized protein n=1 Tax=Vibrio jasicida TaxID=766224 RepID=A0ABW7JAK0_9VIBR